MPRLIPLLVLLAACSDPPAPETPKVPKKPGPADVTTAFLKAYRGKDLDAMRDLSRSENSEVFDDLKRDGEQSARYKSVFSGWRWETARGFAGKVGPVRYRKRYAYVHLANLEELRMVVVAKIFREEGAWRFEDLAKITRAHFEKQLTEEPGDGLR